MELLFVEHTVTYWMQAGCGLSVLAIDEVLASVIAESDDKVYEVLTTGHLEKMVLLNLECKGSYNSEVHSINVTTTLK